MSGTSTCRELQGNVTPPHVRPMMQAVVLEMTKKLPLKTPCENHIETVAMDALTSNPYAQTSHAKIREVSVVSGMPELR